MSFNNYIWTNSMAFPISQSFKNPVTTKFQSFFSPVFHHTKYSFIQKQLLSLFSNLLRSWDSWRHHSVILTILNNTLFNSTTHISWILFAQQDFQVLCFHMHVSVFMYRITYFTGTIKDTWPAYIILLDLDKMIGSHTTVRWHGLTTSRKKGLQYWVSVYPVASPSSVRELIFGRVLSFC